MAIRSKSRSNASGTSAISFAAWSDADLLRDETDPAESFAEFYRRHVDAIIRFAASRGLDANAAADVVSETFVGALKARRRYQPQRDTARLWLLAIASRRIVDLRRLEGQDSRRHQRLRSESVALTPDDHEAYRHLLDADGLGLQVLADLPAVQQQAIRARVVEEREYADIAAALGLSQPATRQHVSRGLARLRDLLGDRA
jgi:RNA polymerase sigma factor (sigma-70 family)